jgi:metal-responsive CopG/Arc/MetJ family transcriptional regulator
VKTAISVPDDTFDLATRRARELGISRSEFFTRAARRYLDDLSTATLTRQIDDTLSAVRADDSGQAAVRAGRKRLADEVDW